MISQVTGIPAGKFVHFLGDAHIYSNHFEQCREQITRIPNDFPIMELNPEIKDIDSFTLEDFNLINYNPHPALKGEVTVVGGF